MTAKKKSKTPNKKSSGLYVEYSSNNSGGPWWLSDKDWRALEKAGWEVFWAKDEKGVLRANEDGRWLGALAQRAIKRNVSGMEEAVEDWERVTKKSSTDAGCACCGQPHSFTLYGTGDKYISSGPDVSYGASW